MIIYERNFPPDQRDIPDNVQEKDTEIAEITLHTEKRKNQALDELRSLEEKYQFLIEEDRKNKRQLNFVVTLSMNMYKHFEFQLRSCMALVLFLKQQAGKEA